MPKPIASASIRNRLTSLVITGLLVSNACSGGSAAPTELGPELVANGSFENGLSRASGWELRSRDDGQVAEWLTGDEVVGRYLSISAPVVIEASWPQAAMTTEFQVRPGTRYLLSMNTRSDDLGLLLPIVWFNDAAGQPIEGRGPGVWTVTSSDWTREEFQLVSSAGAVTAFVLVRLALNDQMTTEPTLSVAVDDVSLREILE